MKKIVAALLLCGALSMQSQETAFKEGGSSVTLGIGFPNLYKAILKSGQSLSVGGGNVVTATGAGPFFLKYEYGVTDRISLGVVLGLYTAGLDEVSNYTEETYDYQTQSYVTHNYKDVSSLSIKNQSIGFRFNYHFGNKEKLDPYFGFAAGYSHTTANVSFTSDNPNSTHGSLTATNPIPIYLGLTFGLRYYFTDNIGLYAECGLDKWAVIQGGLAVKF